MRTLNAFRLKKTAAWVLALSAALASGGAAASFPIESLGGGLYRVNDAKAVAQVYAQSGMLHGLGVSPTPGSTLLGDAKAGHLPDISVELVQMGIRVNGTDYVVVQPDKVVPLNALENAEQSLLLKVSPYKYNDASAGQGIAALQSLPAALQNGDTFEFWFAPSTGGDKTYSSAKPELFTLKTNEHSAELAVVAGALLDALGDPLVSNFSLATYTYNAPTAGKYLVRSSSTEVNVNTLNLYRVDAADGSINGVAPGGAGYADLARGRVVATLKSPDRFRKDEKTFKLQQPGLLSAFLTTPTGTFFPWAAANADGIAHGVRLSDKSFSFEAATGGGDRDFQDLVFSIEPIDKGKGADRILLTKQAVKFGSSGVVSKAPNAVAVKDGVIVGIGKRGDIQARFKGPTTVVENYAGNYLYPGFVDSHEHIFTLANVAIWDGVVNISWPAGSPGNVFTWENITETLIAQLVKFEQGTPGPLAWFGFFGFDNSKFGNPAGSTPQDKLATIYQEAFTNPPPALTLPADPARFGTGNTFINWFQYIQTEAAKRLGIDPATYKRPIIGFLASGHGNVINEHALDEVVKVFPKLGLDVLQQVNVDPTQGQPSGYYDRIDGVFARDGGYGLTGYFNGLALEDGAQAPLIQAFVVSRAQGIVGHIGQHFQANLNERPLIGVTAIADKSYGALTGTPKGDYILQGLLNSSGYQGIRVFGFPFTNQFVENAADWTSFTVNQDKLGVTPFTGNLSVAPVGIKFVLDGSNQAMTGRMPVDAPYLVKDGFPNTIFDETGKGDWEPIGIRDEPYPPPGTPLADNSFLNNLVTQLYRDGWGLTVHANGIQAADMMLDAFEHARAADKGNPKTMSRPLSLQHAPFIPNEQLKRLAKVGGRVSATYGHIQDAYQFGWKGESFNGTGIVGQERGNRIVPAKSMLNLGVKVSMHSDFPISELGSVNSALAPSQNFLIGPVNWMGQLEKRVLESIEPGPNHKTNVVNAKERLGRSQALRAVTIWSAEELNTADWMGSLEVGKLADMVLVDQDLLNPKTSLNYAQPNVAGVTVKQTWVGGKSVYRAQ